MWRCFVPRFPTLSTPHLSRAAAALVRIMGADLRHSAATDENSQAGLQPESSARGSLDGGASPVARVVHLAWATPYHRWYKHRE
jgi:hypothetical protein